MNKHSELEDYAENKLNLASNWGSRFSLWQPTTWDAAAIATARFNCPQGSGETCHLLLGHNSEIFSLGSSIAAISMAG